MENGEWELPLTFITPSPPHLHHPLTFITPSPSPQLDSSARDPTMRATAGGGSVARCFFLVEGQWV